MSEKELRNVGKERRALANLLWDERDGDRCTSIVVLVCGARPEAIEDQLSAALLTDAEMSVPETWPAFDDPFGSWHQEPCGNVAGESSVSIVQNADGGDEP